MDAIKHMKTAFILFMLLSIVTGLIYPAVVTVIAQAIFPWHANGSLVQQKSVAVGSELIGQNFSEAKYFWGRPSATMPYPYNAMSSNGSNYGPMNPELLMAVKNRIATLQQSDTQNHLLIPVDLVTTSASGLDPDISPYAAYYQVHRVAKVRNLPEDQLKILIHDAIHPRFAAVLGEARVNVLELNLALDAFDENHHKG